MRRHLLFAPLAILGLALNTCTSTAHESTTHRITSGTFGVVWIASEGLIYTCSPEGSAAPFRVNHVRAHQVAAIDFDADGRDELAIIDALKQSLFVYDFDDHSMIGGFGHNVAEITVGRFGPDEPFESLIAATYSGDVFRWSKEVGSQGWLPISGDFAKGFRGKVVSRIKTDAVVTVARGDLYTLNPIWNTYSQILLGKDARLAIACDLLARPGDEIVVACGDRHELLLCQNKTATSLGQQATAMTRGKPSGDRETLLVVTPTGTISQYLPTEKTWKDLPAEQTWSDVILHDIDGDGQEELFAVSAQAPEALFQYDATAKCFVRIPHQLLDVSGQPSAVRLKRSGSADFENQCENVTLRSGDRVACDCKLWNTTHKPYVIRMYTPGGRNLLRDSPADHIHHHGLMFAIKANDCDFWAEFPDQPQGKQELLDVATGVVPDDPHSSWVTAVLAWKNAAGQEVLREKRTLTTVPLDRATLLTWKSELSKTEDEPVKLDGSHYFGLGMRFVESMDQGGTFRFSDDHGEPTLVRGDERVTKASWAAYTAAVDGGQPATAVIFSHPENLRPMYAFTMGDDSPAFAFLAATLNLYREPFDWKGDAVITLRWGVGLLDGEPSQEEIDQLYDAWKTLQE